MNHTVKGFTLIELMVVVAISAVLLAVAAPSFKPMFDKQRVKSATEQLHGAFQFARSEAVQRNKKVKVTFDSAAWCYIIHTADDTCACSNSGGGSCTTAATNNLKHVQGTDFRGVSIGLPAGVSSFTFEPQRGGLDTGSPAGAVIFSMNASMSLGSKLNTLGRVKFCTPSGSQNTGYEAC